MRLSTLLRGIAKKKKDAKARMRQRYALARSFGLSSVLASRVSGWAEQHIRDFVKDHHGH